MKQLLLIPLIMAAVLGCNAKKSDKPPPRPTLILPILDDYYEQRLKLFPIEATTQGDNRYNDQLPNDISPGFLARQRHFTPLRWIN